MLRRTFACVSVILLAACGEPPKTEVKQAEPPKPVEPVGGRYAFYQMYAAARSWATDLEPLQLFSVPIKEVPAKGGKYGAWRVKFVSASKRSAKTYTYSVVDSDGIHKGIYGAVEESYSGPTGQSSPFPIAALKVDSDAAYETAVKKSADYIKKNPDKMVSFVLERTKRFPNPAWRVIWGDSIATSNYSIYVDASSGEYLQTMH